MLIFKNNRLILLDFLIQITSFKNNHIKSISSVRIDVIYTLLNNLLLLKIIF